MKPELVSEKKLTELLRRNCYGAKPAPDAATWCSHVRAGTPCPMTCLHYRDMRAGAHVALEELGIVLVVEFSPDLVHMKSHLDNYCVDLEEGPVLLKAKED